MRARVLVPRFLDEANTNAQNLNAKALLARFRAPDFTWLATHYAAPDAAATSNSQVRLVRLWRGRLSRVRMFLFYLQRADGLFYPGGVPDAHRALRIARWLHRDRPVIATLEGLPGTEERERWLSRVAGHCVYCHRVDARLQDRLDRVLHDAHHIIAISPFLARMGAALYGDKVSTLPLGIDTAVFHATNRRTPARPLVVSAGALRAHKRPDLFLALAKRHPEADFVWYGDGDLREGLLEEVQATGLSNVRFPGSLPPAQLADAFRGADLFVMPSRSEGAPKVAQEAAACGLPVVLFGFYEAPSVTDGENGFVVWDDKAMFERVGVLLGDAALRRRMGHEGAARSAELAWDVVAPHWEGRVRDLISAVPGGTRG